MAGLVFKLTNYCKYNLFSIEYGGGNVITENKYFYNMQTSTQNADAMVIQIHIEQISFCMGGFKSRTHFSEISQNFCFDTI